MKHFFTSLFLLLFSLTTFSQVVDSVVIRITQSRGDGSQWEFEAQYIDSFSSGRQTCELHRYWSAGQWLNSTLYNYQRDTSGTIIQKDYLVWNNTQWANSTRWSYTYWTNDSLLTLLTEQWNGASWANDRLETHSFNGNGSDTLILYSIWTGIAWRDSIKSDRIFGPDFHLTEDTISAWDVLNGVWQLNTHHIYTTDSAGRITSVTEQFYNGTSWVNNTQFYYTYDSAGNSFVYAESWWDNTNGWYVAYMTDYQFTACNLRESFYWNCFVGACGVSYGNWVYDSLCHETYSFSHSESMGGIVSEFQEYVYYLYFPGADALEVFANPALTKCSADSEHVGSFVIGGTPPLHFQWNPSAGLTSDTVENPIVFADTTTQYSCVVTDSTGSTASDTILVNVNPSPAANILIQSVDTASLCNSAILVADSLEHIICNWYHSGIQEQNPFGFGAAHFRIDENGWYKVRVTNDYNCPGYDSINISFFTHPAPAVSIASNCNTLTAQGTGLQSYQWYKNGAQLNGSVYDTLNAFLPGSYSVSVTDSNGCQNSSDALYFQPMLIQLPNYMTCEDTCNGSTLANVYAGISPYQYLWSNGQTTQQLTNLCGGFYSVTVTDNRGCIASGNVTITFLPRLSVQFNQSTVSDTSLCNGVAYVTIQGQLDSLYHQYEWTGGSHSYEANNLCTGWNYVTTHDLYTQCTQTDSTLITGSSTSDSCHFTLSYTTPYCHGDCSGGIIVDQTFGTAPYNFLWINPSSAGINQAVSGLCSGSYSLLMIDGTGCIDTLTQVLADPDSIQGIFSLLYANPNQPCSTLVGVSLENAHDPSSIYWQCTGANGSQAYLCPGICEVTVQDAYGCQSILSFDVPDSAVACSVIPAVNSISCFGSCDGNITASTNGVPPFSYQWSNGDSIVTISNLCAGNYTVIMTDSAGCTDTATVTITEPPALTTSTVTSYVNCSCNFIVNPAGGTPPYAYQWCDGSTTQQMVNCNPGNCAVVISDSNGCSVVDSVVIIPLIPVSIFAVSTPATCTGCLDGTVTGTPVDGTPPYTYTLQPGGMTSTSGIFSGLAAGNYTICVTDSNGCTSCNPVTVTQPQTNCSVMVSETNALHCYGDCNGSLSAVANGVPPFHFLWSNNDTTSFADNLCAGNYSVIMTDSVGCIDSIAFTLSQPPVLSASIISSYANCNCTFILNPSGGTPPYFYQWCDGSNAQQMVNCSQGVCIVQIDDANGCFIQDTVIISPPPALGLNSVTAGTSCGGCSDGSITATAFGGTLPYLYELQPGGQFNTTGIFGALPAGNYFVCVTDGDSCQTCDSVAVPDDPTGIPFVSREYVRVYPNPVTDEAIIDIHAASLPERVEFTLQDVLGKELFSIPLTGRRTSFNRKGLSGGIYFYTIRFPGQSVINGKLVISD